MFGAGVQGTVFAVRLARAGHHVTLVARGERATFLREHGAVIDDAVSNNRIACKLSVIEHVAPDVQADVCFVTVRREQLDDAVQALAAAPGLRRVVVMVNHAQGSVDLIGRLGQRRTVLAFPGVAGSIEESATRFVDVTQQPTTVEAGAVDIIELLRGAGFRVAPVRDMDAWLRRHAVFVTAVAGALYLVGCDARRLAADRRLVETVVLAVREGWAAQDRQGIAPAPLALRAIFCWVPMPLARTYWMRLFASSKGELYFARHTRHAGNEMAALVADLREFASGTAMPHLARLHAAIKDQYRRAPER